MLRSVLDFYASSIFPRLKRHKIKREFRECMQGVRLDCIFGKVEDTAAKVKYAYRLVNQAEGFNKFYGDKTAPLDTERMNLAVNYAEHMADEAYWMVWLHATGPNSQGK
jgi:hypothetical protein